MLKEIFYYYLNTQQIMHNILNRATGTTVTGIRQSELRKVKMIFPDVRVQNKIRQFLSNNVNKVSALNDENNNLKKLRDTLLPKLMSGEVSVKFEEKE